MSYQYRDMRGREEESFRPAGHRKRRSSGPGPPYDVKTSRGDSGRRPGVSSFERMARSVLAGTLQEADTTPSPASDYPVFGIPIPRPLSPPTPPLAPPPPLIFGEMFQNSQSQYSHSHSSSIPRSLEAFPNEATAGSPAASSTSVRMKNNLVEHFQKNLTEMVSKAQAELSVSDEDPSRILCLERFFSKEELLMIYQNVFILPCRHKVCKKPNCLHFPVIKDPSPAGQTLLEFSCESRAAIFKRFLSSSGVRSAFVPSSKLCRYRSVTSLMVQAEFKKGIPKRSLLESFCVCPVVLHSISAASVEDGLVWAPVKISFYTGRG